MTHLVSNEQPLAIVPVLPKTDSVSSQYVSQPVLNETPLYSNLLPDTLTKSQSFTNKRDSVEEKTSPRVSCNLQDLHLDPVILREAHMLQSFTEKRKSLDHRLDNDLTLQDKENSLLSASRLRLLQDTTMIESALDLDSLDDSSIGTNSQAGLMKIVV